MDFFFFEQFTNIVKLEEMTFIQRNVKKAQGLTPVYSLNNMLF